VGDTQRKWAYFDPDSLRALGVEVEEHGKMPDVVVHHASKNWLVLIEAVTSHGPVNPKRRLELSKLFANSKAGMVYVTAFMNRRTMIRYLDEISWETEVWVAESPTHLIHFNGERFLGPYEQSVSAGPESPGGTADDGPSLQRWVTRARRPPKPPRGERRGTRRRGSFVPGGTLFVFCPGSPA